MQSSLQTSRVSPPASTNGRSISAAEPRLPLPLPRHVGHFRCSSSPLRHRTQQPSGRRRGECCQLSAYATADLEPPALVNSSAEAPVEEKVGVLLLNLGGPETLQDVQPFLYNLFADPDIIRLPEYAKFLQPVVAQVISTLRAPKSSEGYRAIGGGSPLRKITLEQADALAEALHRKGQPASVYVAMRYWKPFTEDAIAQVKADGVTKLVVLPLYPQFSISTSGSSFRLLEEMIQADAWLSSTMQHIAIPSWYGRAGYISAMVDLIEEELTHFQRKEEVEVFFSAHGVPLSYVNQAGDPYKEEMEECVDKIVEEMRRRGIENSFTLAYQSRVGPVEWLKPYTDESIRELGAQGCRSMLAVPVSFVSEHIETLEEMDMEYRELALESGIRDWRRVPALNTNAKFIDDLADAVLQALPHTNSMAASPSNDLVPMGTIGELREVYDSGRQVLPLPTAATSWSWGWTRSAETWNGRIAMLAIVVVLILEVITGQGVLSGRLE